MRPTQITILLLAVPLAASLTTNMKSNPATAGKVHRTLDVLHRRRFLDDTRKVFADVLSEVSFFRPEYVSRRFGKQCKTPCWTTVYGGNKEHPLYEPVPPSLGVLQKQVEKETGLKYNVCLVRMYYDSKDHIAWHTDARSFLGSPTSVASLSMGAPRVFDMRMPVELWPTPGGAGCGTVKDVSAFAGDDLVDAPSTAHVTSPVEASFLLMDGDLLVMNGKTQDFWHHRVPTESARNYHKRLIQMGCEPTPEKLPAPRLNINFRYIPPGPLSLSGTDTYYQYCRAGVSALPDEQAADRARAKCENPTVFNVNEVIPLVFGGEKKGRFVEQSLKGTSKKRSPRQATLFEFTNVKSQKQKKG